MTQQNKEEEETSYVTPPEIPTVTTSVNKKPYKVNPEHLKDWLNDAFKDQ